MICFNVKLKSLESVGMVVSERYSIITHGNLSRSYNIVAMNYHFHIYLNYTNGIFLSNRILVKHSL